MRQNPTIWKGCVHGAARCGATWVILTWVTVFILELIHAPNPVIFGRVVFAARRDAGHSCTGNRGSSRANTCAKTRHLGRVVFAARRGAARVIFTRVTVVILERIHAPKPDIFGGIVFTARRGAERRGSFLHG